MRQINYPYNGVVIKDQSWITYGSLLYPNINLEVSIAIRAEKEISKKQRKS